MDKRSTASGFEPDPRLGRLFAHIEPKDDILPWEKVQRLVSDAPPARVPWYYAFTSTTKPMRLAFAPMAALLLIAVLWVAPASSIQVGTLVTNQLPATWDPGSIEMNEIQSAAKNSFSALAIPQSEMHIKLGTNHGRPQLALALFGVDDAAARDFYASLADRFPGLDAFEPAYSTISSDVYGNRLEQVLAVFSKDTRKLHGMDNAELQLLAVKALRQAGFDQIKVEVQRNTDGTVVIEIDAAMRFAVEGHTQEDLEAAGLSEELLGKEAFEALLAEMDAK